MTSFKKKAWILVIAGIVLINVGSRLQESGAFGDGATAVLSLLMLVAGLSSLVIGIVRLVRREPVVPLQ